MHRFIFIQRVVWRRGGRGGLEEGGAVGEEGWRWEGPDGGQQETQQRAAYYTAAAAAPCTFCHCAAAAAAAATEQRLQSEHGD